MLWQVAEQYLAFDRRVAGIGAWHVGFAHSRGLEGVVSMPSTSALNDEVADRYRSDRQDADLHGCKRRVTDFGVGGLEASEGIGPRAVGLSS